MLKSCDLREVAFLFITMYVNTNVCGSLLNLALRKCGGGDKSASSFIDSVPVFSERLFLICKTIEMIG